MEFFSSLRGKLDYVHLKDFLKYERKLYLKQPIDTTTMQDHCSTPQLKIIELLLKLNSDQLSLSLEMKNYATFTLIM